MIKILGLFGLITFKNVTLFLSTFYLSPFKADDSLENKQIIKKQENTIF